MLQPLDLSTCWMHFYKVKTTVNVILSSTYMKQEQRLRSSFIEMNPLVMQ